MTLMYKPLIGLFICGLYFGFCQENGCEGYQCNIANSDDNILLQSRANIFKMDVEGMDEGKQGIAKSIEGKMCGWINMNRGIASQSSACWGAIASRAIDGNNNTDFRRGRSCSSTCRNGSVQWFKWTTDRAVDIQKVKVVAGSHASSDLRGLEISVDGQQCAKEDGTWSSKETKEFSCTASGMVVELKAPRKRYLSICELMMYGCWEMIDFSYQITESDAKDAQFLMKASFGPTRATMTELKDAGSKKDWIKSQAAIPLNSHRKYFREHVNPVFDASTMNEKTHSHSKGENGFQMHAKSPCAEGSRWANYAFTKAEHGKELTLKNSKVFVAGEFLFDATSSPTTCTDEPDWYLKRKKLECNSSKMRTYVTRRCDDASWSDDNLCQQTCFDTGYGREGDDCSVGWAKLDESKTYKVCGVTPRMGAKIKLAMVPASLLQDEAATQSDASEIGQESYAEKEEEEDEMLSLNFMEEETNFTGAPKSSGRDPCDQKENVVYMTNPVVRVSDDASFKKTSLTFESVPNVPNVIFLAAGNPVICGLMGTNFIEHNGTFYRRDGRLELVDNDINNPTVCAARTGLNRKGCKVNAAGGTCSLSCGTPNEVANVGKYGHNFEFRFMDLRDSPPDYRFDHKYLSRPFRKDNEPAIIWTQIGLEGADQLRQRVAWALSQIVVTSREDGVSSTTEVWTYFYDIFVRHAFGNYRDILQEVTNSPVMAAYLTYNGNKAFDASGSFPDENYAREIMQLFTIGLEKLNMDGSVVMDKDNRVVETYTNEHIMNFARVLTGYGKRRYRWNLERRYKGPGDNHIDQLDMSVKSHDKFPKPDLDGNYLGDFTPLCLDLPKKAFLAKGARYEFAGYEDRPATVLDTASSLFGKLCPQGAGSCEFLGYLELDETVECEGIECDIQGVEDVKVDNAYYRYLPPTCVYSFFSNQVKTQHWKSMKWTPRAGRSHWWSKCQPADAPAAGFACCGGCTDTGNGWMRRKKIGCNETETKWQRRGVSRMFSSYCAKNRGWRRHKTCQMSCWKNSAEFGGIAQAYDGSAECANGPYREELKCDSRADKTSYVAAQAYCASKGLSICKKPAGTYFDCGNYKETRSDQLFLWKGDLCEVKATVHGDGKVSSSTKSPEENKFAVNWIGGPAPAGTYTLNVTTVAVFAGVPSKDDIQKLKIGAFPPSVDCTHSCDSEVKAYAVNGTIDEGTVFEYQGKYYKNTESQVSLSSGHKFRNPPVFLKSTDSSARQKYAAFAEVDAFLDHLFYHPNTPVFIGKKLIQRFESSSPSPAYVEAVAGAFVNGTYDGIGSGKYGCLLATVAAIFLYPTENVLPVKSNGLLREPILRVMHVIRSLEYTDDYPIYIKTKGIGQYPYFSPTVFNFYEATYSPPDFSDYADSPVHQSMLAPEFQIFTPPQAIGLMNNLMLLLKDGVSHCSGGFSDRTGGWYQDRFRGSCKRGHFGVQEQATPAETLKLIDTLMTGGRVTDLDRNMIASAYDNGPPGKKIKMAERALIFTPEFNVLGDPKPTGVREEETPKKHVAKASYKAMVNIFFHGGADTYQMLVPRDCKLHDDYTTVRKGMDLSMKSLLPITSKTQVCKNFGLHPKLTSLQQLYNDGELAFVANVGTLKRSTVRSELRSGSYKLCSSQYSHSHAQAAAQTMHCQMPTSAKGVGGKIADALEKSQGFLSSSFSLAGMATWSEGRATHVDVLSSDGVKTLKDYDRTKPLMLNVTGEIYENSYCEEYGKQLKAAVLRSQELDEQLAGADDAIKNYKTGSKLNNQFRQVARAIAVHKERNAERDFFFVSLGGFDTHSNVVEILDLRFDAISKAIDGFVKNLKAQNMYDSVVVTSESDFGRTLSFNGAGSDHGWGGNYFVFGGAVNGGEIYNDFLETYAPGSDYDAGRGRVIPKYPWESFFAPIAKWLGVEDADMDTVFPNLKNFNSSLIISQDTLFKK